MSVLQIPASRTRTSAHRGRNFGSGLSLRTRVLLLTANASTTPLLEHAIDVFDGLVELPYDAASREARGAGQTAQFGFHFNGRSQVQVQGPMDFFRNRRSTDPRAASKPLLLFRV
jgi:hypothetical protein